MRALRNHWLGLSFGLVAVVVGSLGVWHVLVAPRATAMMAEPTYTPLSKVRHDAIRNVLADASLDAEALIALNLSSSQAESLVSAVRTWYESNESTLNAELADIAAKTQALRDKEQTIRMGPYSAENETARATAVSDLAAARTAYRTTLQGLDTGVNNILSESQRSTWAAIKTGWGQKMPVRMLSLTDAQRISVSDIEHRYERQVAAANSQAERDTAASARQTALSSVLTQEQLTVMSSYPSYYASSSSAVNSALAEVLATE